MGKCFKRTDECCPFHRGKRHPGFAPAGTVWDLRSLRRFIDHEEFDLVNVHHSHDHILGVMTTGLSKKRPVAIRTDHKREPWRPTWGNRVLLRRFTDGLMTFSEASKRAYCEHFSFPVERMGKISPALDLDMINARKPYRDMISEFGIGQGGPVLGIVARFQKYRRTEILLRAIKLLTKEIPNIRGLLVGRSSQMAESVIRPMEQMGLREHVILAGYRGEDYFDTVASMDILVFLMAGSDGTGRTMREAMALGKPIVAANRGMLPEIVEDGVSGIVVEDTPENVAEALTRLIRDRDLRKKWGCSSGEGPEGFSP